MRRIIFTDNFHNIFFIVAVVGLLFTLTSLIMHIYSAFDFTILKIDRICEQPLNNRCVDYYLVSRKNGSSGILTFPAYKFQESELVVGNSIRKDRFMVAYWVNGKKVQWRYLTLHVVGIAASCLIFVWWQYLSRKLAGI